MAGKKVAPPPLKPMPARALQPYKPGNAKRYNLGSGGIPGLRYLVYYVKGKR